MSKAILVIDMPESCADCRIRVDDEYSNWCPYANPEPNGVWQYVEKATKPYWCTLKPIPEKYEIDKSKCSNPGYKFEYEYGYNTCIDEILGGSI